MPIDPRMTKVVRDINAIATATGTSIINLDQLATLITACACSKDTRRCLTSLIYGAVELADKVDAADQERTITAQLLASLG